MAGILPDIIAFASGLGIALILRWNTTDLVWSLWLSSLVLGYLTILSAIGGTVYTGIKTIKFATKFDEFPKDWQKPALIIGSAVVLFMFVFFSFHFCGFHAGHAIFLSHFFSVEGITVENFFRSFMNPIALWKTVFQHILPVYGIFLIPIIIAERKYIFAFFNRPMKEAIDEMNLRDGRKIQEMRTVPQKTLESFILRPYVNVIRMHIMIFFFAFCFMLKIDSRIIYIVVYLVYFFPWSALKRKSDNPEKAA